MTDRDEMLAAVERDLQKRSCDFSIEELRDKLNTLSIGIPQRIPVAFRDTRLFRVRPMDNRPATLDQVGAPPPTLAPIGRLNDIDQSVLYLSDSPETAFAEARVKVGYFCLSEWRTTAEKLGMANGGLASAILAERFTHDIYEGDKPLPQPTEQDETVLALFREIYTLNVGTQNELYRWSIACGLANGFSHQCERQSAETTDGFTHWNGRYPFSAIAYPSVRANRPSLNFAFNDLGRSHLHLNHLQWVRRADDGRYVSLDFASSWDNEQRIHWQGRAAQFQLKPGEGAKLTKLADGTFLYEMADGSIPWFV